MYRIVLTPTQPGERILSTIGPSAAHTEDERRDTSNAQAARSPLPGWSRLSDRKFRLGSMGPSTGIDPSEPNRKSQTRRNRDGRTSSRQRRKHVEVAGSHQLTDRIVRRHNPVRLFRGFTGYCMTEARVKDLKGRPLLPFESRPTQELPLGMRVYREAR